MSAGARCCAAGVSIPPRIIASSSARQASGTRNELIDSRDYPVLAARYGGEAIITARLMVDAAGAVTKCTAISDFAEPEMQQLICRNLSKAVFKPAMTADGEAAPDYALLTFRFGMEP